MGGGDVHAVLLPVRDPHRRAGRSHRPAPRTDASRAVVVSLHVADRHGVQLPLSPVDAILLRRRRSGRISERIDRRLAVVPRDPAREHVRSPADGEPDWRGGRAAVGGACPDPLWMARILLCVRHGGRDLGSSLVCLVSRFSRREVRSEPGGTRGDSGLSTRRRRRTVFLGRSHCVPKARWP